MPKKKAGRKKIVARKKAPVKRAKKPVKKLTKKLSKKLTKKKALTRAAKPKENVIGKVTHYFPHVRAAVIKLKAPLALGDKIKIKGHTTDFTQAVVSMQIDRVDIQVAKKGQEIGLLVNSRVRQHDEVILV